MNVYEFNDVDYRVYHLVNGGVIAKALEVADEHRGGFSGFLHDTIGLCNYTHSKTNRALWFTIHKNADSYTMEIKWAATKMKGEGLVSFRKQAAEGQPTLPVEGKWRDVICSYIHSLHSYCRRFEIVLADLDNGKDYPVTVRAEVAFERLISPPTDKVPDDFDVRTKSFKSPIELLAGVIDENVLSALDVFGKDHKRLVEILHPFEGKLFVADFLIGASLYMFEKMPKHAYAYFQRASENLDQIDSPEVASQLFEFMGSIEHQQLSKPAEAEQNLIKALVLGSEQSLLKLAYSYLVRPNQDNKAIALKLSRAAETILHLDEEEWHRVAGYHIAASVYVWNGCYEEAAAIQNQFLENEGWCLKFKDQIESYLILCLSKNEIDFISNLITDYPVLQNHFGYMFETWHYGVLHPEKDGFQMYMVPLMNRINSAKTMYS